MPITINGRVYSDAEVAEMARQAVYGPPAPAVTLPVGQTFPTVQEALNREAGRSLPVQGGAIPKPGSKDSLYGMRKHPILRREKMHHGYDFNRDLTGKGRIGGRAVQAVKAGEVIWADRKKGYGNRVEVRHADGTITTYSHLQNKSLAVKVGDTVKSGQRLGRVGSTGLSTADHLHFELYANEAALKANKSSDPTPAQQ